MIHPSFLGRTALAVALSAAPLSAFAGTAHTSGLKAGETYDRFMVTFAKGSAEDRSHAARQSLLDTVGNAAKVDVAQLRRLSVGADVIRTHRKLDRAGAEAFMRRLAADPRVAFVQVEGRVQATWSPNDPYLPSQWHYTASQGINLAPAWDRSRGNGVVVAVLDTGHTHHSDMQHKYFSGYDFISDPPTARDGDGRDGSTYDQGDWIAGGDCGPGIADRASSWHGTHVAGTIAALTNNGQGVAGVAPEAFVQPVRVLGHCGGQEGDLVDAITWASGGTVDGAPANPTPAQVINLSLGIAGACTAGSPLQLAIDGAVARGAVVVAAAGNSSASTSLYRPASCNNVITVAAVHGAGGLAWYSNYGSHVDVSAPGGQDTGVLSTTNAGLTYATFEDYAYKIGTSQAAAHVSGVVALMQGAQVNSPARVESLLKGNVRPFTSGCATGCGTGIVDAHAAVYNARPVASIHDVTLFEGSAGTTQATVTVGLSYPAIAPVTFNVLVCQCSTGTATEGVDFDATDLVGLTIPAGQSSVTFAVPIVGDTNDEPDETFGMAIQSLANANYGDYTATVKIVNDDVILTMGNSTRAEGDSGEVVAPFVAKLSKATSLPVTFTLGTQNGTGTTANGDYDAYSALPVSIPAGATSATFYVTANGDTAVEPNETVQLLITNASGATVGDAQGILTILNDDGPTLSINDIAPGEGNSGIKQAGFWVTLSEPATVPVTYNIATYDLTATAGGDYEATTLVSQVIPAGMTARTFMVPLVGDTTAEENEKFEVRITAATGASLFDMTGVATIVNDDGAVIRIVDPAFGEGDTGTMGGNFSITVMPAVASTTNCTATTVDGTAVAGSDYVARSASIAIPAGQTSATFGPVTINGDVLVESNETFSVVLTCPDSNAATLQDGTATATIVNDD